MVNSEQIQLEPTPINEIDEEFCKIVRNELEEIERFEKRHKKSNLDDDDLRSKQKANETTPKNPTKSRNLQPYSRTLTRLSRSFKCELFPSTSSSVLQSRTKKKFSLGEIYKRIYNSYPSNSHDAESDVMSLLKCALGYKEDFVRIVNETCIDFNDIKKF